MTESNGSGISARDVAELGGFAGSFVMGFDPFQAWTLAAKLMRCGRKEHVWLDWVGEGWQKFYYADLSRVVRLDLLTRDFVLPQVLELDNTSDNLPLTSFSVEIDQSEPEFKAKPRFTERNRKIIRYYRELRRSVLHRDRAELFDGSVARLAEVGPDRTLIFQKAAYFDYLQTNLAMDNAQAATSLRDELHAPSGKVAVLRESPLGNHAGLNVLIFSSGGEAVVQGRSLRVLVRPSELCSSASGALGFSDVEPAQDRQASLADVSLTREIEQELGRPVAEGVMRSGSLEFLGLTRELIRGGKPELFFVARCDLTWDQILKSFANCKAAQSGESEELVSLDLNPFHDVTLPELQDRHRSGEFKAKLNTALGHLERSGKVSVPLLTNLALWAHYKLAGGR